MQPRHSRETFMPVRPRFTYCMPVMLPRRLDVGVLVCPPVRDGCSAWPSGQPGADLKPARCRPEANQVPTWRSALQSGPEPSSFCTTATAFSSPSCRNPGRGSRKDFLDGLLRNGFSRMYCRIFVSAFVFLHRTCTISSRVRLPQAFSRGLGKVIAGVLLRELNEHPLRSDQSQRPSTSIWT